MTKEQMAAALHLVSLLEGDLEGQANAETYGDWFKHLTTHLVDELTEEDN